jgi:hypothetical protein
MKLKFLGALMLAAAAALAISYGSTVAQAGYNGGNPSKKGDMCFKKTDGRGHGYWSSCAHH